MTSPVSLRHQQAGNQPRGQAARVLRSSVLLSPVFVCADLRRSDEILLVVWDSATAKSGVTSMVVSWSQYFWWVCRIEEDIIAGQSKNIGHYNMLNLYWIQILDWPGVSSSNWKFDMSISNK